MDYSKCSSDCERLMADGTCSESKKECAYKEGERLHQEIVKEIIAVFGKHGIDKEQAMCVLLDLAVDTYSALLVDNYRRKARMTIVDLGDLFKGEFKGFE